MMATSLSRSKFTFHDDRSSSDDYCSKRRKYDFTSWTISYEVGIKMVDQTELHCNEGWLTHLARSVLGTHERHETHSTVKHIVLDFASTFAYTAVYTPLES
jgi:hypothetical protein